MADFVPYEDIVTILFGPNPQQKLNEFWKSIEVMTTSKFSTMQSKLINNMKEQFSSMTNEINAQNIKLQASITGQIEKVKQLKTAEQEQLQQIEKLAKATSKEALELEKLRQATAQATQERKREAKILNEQEGSYKRMSLELQKHIDKYKSLSKAERENAQVGGQLLKTIQGQQTELKRMDASMGNFQRNVGNYRSAIEGLPGPIGMVASRTSNLVSSIGRLGPAGAAVAGVLTGLAAPMVAFFTKSEEGSELFERKLNGLKASLRVLLGDLISVGDKLTTNLQKPEKSKFWTKFLSGFGLLGTAVGIQMDQANNSAQEYTQTLQDLEDQERSMIVPRAEANKKIAEAKLLYEDESRSIKDRIAALKLSLQLEINTLNNEIEYQDKVIENIKKINEEKKAVGQFRDEDDLRLQEAIAKKIDLQTESMMKQRKVQSTINNAYDELIKQQNAMNDAALDLKQIMEDWDKELEGSLKEWLGTSTDTVKDDMAKIDAGLKAFIQSHDEYENQLTDFMSRMGILRSQDYEKDVAMLKDALDRKKIQEKDYFLYRIKLWISANRELINEIENLNTQVFSLVDNIYKSLEDTAKREIDLYDNRIDALKSSLDQEKELKDKGKANDYDRLVDQLASEQSLREKAQKKYETYQKRQAQLKFLETQANLGVSVAEAFAANAGEGPVGWIVAIAAAAALVSAFVSMQNQIKNIGKYAEGTEYLQRGRNPKGRDTIPIMANEGERIVPTDINKKLDGIDNEKLPEIYRLYKYNYLKGTGAVHIESNREVVRVLKRGLTVNEQMLSEMKRPRIIDSKPLSGNRELITWSNGNTQIISYPS